MKKEASDSWIVHDFPCLLDSEKRVFNYRYEKYIVETSFCWRQGKHYALSLLPKHLKGSTHRALPTPPAAPYLLHPQSPACSTRSTLPPPSLRLLCSCAAFTNHTGVQYSRVPAASLESEQGSAVRKCFLNEKYGLQNWNSDDLYRKRVTLDGWSVVLRNKVPGMRGAF